LGRITTFAITCVIDIIIIFSALNSIKVKRITLVETKKIDNVNDELFALLENMDFDIKRLTWHSEESVTVFNQIVKQSSKVVELSEENVASTEQFRILAKTQDIPKDAIATSKKLSKEFCENLKKSFIESNDEKYNVIRDVLKK
jgi:ABC-type phosphate/phosphonate transport system substrate-binding protein